MALRRRSMQRAGQDDLAHAQYAAPAEWGRAKMAARSGGAAE